MAEAEAPAGPRSRRARRTRWAFLRCGDGAFVDLAALLRGEARVAFRPELQAVSILTGATSTLDRDELELLLALPADGWAECDSEHLDAVAAKGLAVVEGGETAALDERLARLEWNLYGALYHARTRWSGVTVPLETPPQVAEAFTEGATRAFMAEHGAPPQHFSSRGGPARRLSRAELEGPFHDVLVARRTARAFARRRVAETDLSLVLRAAFGVQGLTRVADDWLALRKTSPSGGALHPVEAYPLVLAVDGVAPGLYHYHCGDHALEPLEAIDEAAGRSLAVAWTCGQGYFGDAAVLVVLAARFERAFWKYRRHEKAYAVTLLDAGHLSQTFQLVCASVRLGAFVTAAVNNADIDARLGLDGFAEGALAIVGCGVPAAGESPLEPGFAPHRPAG